MYLEEKLDYLISEQKRLTEMVELFLPNIENEKGVIHFLEITKNTFNSYVRDGTLQEGIHFSTKNNKRIFIPVEIVKFKKSGIKGRRKTSENDQQIIHAIKGKLGIIATCRHVEQRSSI